MAASVHVLMHVNFAAKIIDCRQWSSWSEKGLVRAIGLSNFSITKTENLLKTANIVPAVIQGTTGILIHRLMLCLWLSEVECHPYFQQPKLRRYCKQTGHHYLSIVSA